ncbi:MAG: ATP phosphoribosyltransferase regulatory subunit, partial [Armatimonadota bacterium]
MPRYTAPRGTADVLPAESPKWEYVESRFRQACALFGYREVRTPTFEHTELFTRNLGETTDVVSKEMYTFKDRGDRSITLRPEGTAPAIRAYVEHNLAASLPVTKMYYIGRIFRYERPQAGRYRE